jgi:hypothetical protein
MPRIRATRADAQAFVKSLKDFSDTLLPEQRAMLGTILDAAQQDETSGYGKKWPRSAAGAVADENETAGYGRRIYRSTSDETAEEDDTAGYGRKIIRSETLGQDDGGRWEGLVEWLAAGEGGEDETEGFSIKKL